MTELALVLAFVAAGALAAAFALYLLAFALAALLRPRRPAPASAASSRVVVLVPAHDEHELIGRCVASLRRQDYPADRHEVVVVADNCSDDTAACAEAAAARVLVRTDPGARGKGRALRWAIDRLLQEDPRWDAVAVVDADSVAHPDFLRLLVAPFEAGAAAVQGESLLAGDDSPRTALRAAAFLLINRVRPAGRAALGLPCNLCGNGMLLGRELLVAHPWSAFTSAEDLEYTLALRRAGIGPAFAAGAVVVSPPAPDARAAAEQELRWEGGKLRLARTWIPALVAAAIRHRRPLCLDAAFELALPPLGALAGATAAATAAGTGLAAAGLLPAWALAPWLAALVVLPLFVLVGLLAADAPGTAYRALASAPALVVRKALRAPRLLRFRADSWVRTPRGTGEAAVERPTEDAASLP